ncbi:MAG: hypothetical protein MHM6MM_001120 [Cercozoa sp. M6MM]
MRESQPLDLLTDEAMWRMIADFDEALRTDRFDGSYTAMCRLEGGACELINPLTQFLSQSDANQARKTPMLSPLSLVDLPAVVSARRFCSPIYRDVLALRNRATQTVIAHETTLPDAQCPTGMKIGDAVAILVSWPISAPSSNDDATLDFARSVLDYALEYINFQCNRYGTERYSTS